MKKIFLLVSVVSSYAGAQATINEARLETERNASEQALRTACEKSPALHTQIMYCNQLGGASCQKKERDIACCMEQTKAPARKACLEKYKGKLNQEMSEFLSCIHKHL